jgi:pimeloyl-ACP methyl ester carboxylesterase
VRSRPGVVLVGLFVLALGTPTPSAGATAASLRGVRGTKVEFEVHNSADNNAAYRVLGTLHRARCRATSVVLLQHGLSYTGDAWNVDGYSVARALTEAGYDVVAIDKLGYRRSPLADGRKVNVLAYGDMAHQIVQALRGRYRHVAIGGHSAGAEESENATALYGDVDALLALAYDHFPSVEIVSDVVTGDDPRAATSSNGYEYFLGTPQHRAEMFFTGDAERRIVAADMRAAQPTPSGEMLSISPQPSGKVLSLITAPVFLQLATHDRLFPAADIDREALMFTSTKVTTDVVSGDGHTFMLHRNGVVAAQRMTKWLRSQPATPGCR